MKLNVILPFFSNTPVGGIKVIYEYVNYLVSQGHKVIIYYLPDYCVPFHRIPKSIERKWRKIIQERQTIHWFNLDKRVIRRSVPSINNENIEDADAVLASAIVTALPVSALSEKKGNKVYLIQDFENWGIKDKDVYNTYSVGMCNIVVSKWLKKLVDQYSKSPSILISNGINLNIFKIIVPISQRHRHSIVFHYRNESIKGAKYAIQVVQRLENLYDDLLVYVIGKGPKPNSLPKSCIYLHNLTPEQVCVINNKASVFLCTSIQEGFGLPGLEAMACGCVLVSTEYEGVLEYAKNGENSLLSPVKDVDSLCLDIAEVFENFSLQEHLSNNALVSASKRDYKKNCIEFEKLLLSLSKRDE